MQHRLIYRVIMACAAASCAPQAKTKPAADLPDVEARADVDHASATTGDVITYTVEIEHKPDITIHIPDPGSDIAGLRIIDSGHEPPQTEDGRVHERRWFKLRADLVGSYVLPPVTAIYQEGDKPVKTLSTSEIFLEVKSVLPSTDSGTSPATDIHDLKPLKEVHYRPRWLFPVIGLVVAAALLALLAWWRQRRPKAYAKPATPPHQVAFAALDALRRTDFTDAAQVRRYYFAISEVIRTYVEARFALNATDLTTEEIVAQLHNTSALVPAERSRLKEFLVDTDQVKFAGHVPDSREIEQTYERGLAFVEATRPQPPPEVATP